MNIKKILIITLFSFFLFSSTTYAEERTCSYTNLANAKRIASKVTTSYEIKYNENNTPYFVVSIYNITDELVVGVRSDDVNSSTQFIYYDMTDDGVYSFENYNIETIENYQFEISTVKYDCNEILRKTSLTKPKRNIIHDDPECSYAETVNSYYCQEWITKDMAYSYETIVKKIRDQRINEQNKTTTKKVEEEVTTNKIMKKLKGAILYIVIGLGIAIFVDLIMIIINIVKIKKDDDL